ncbi:MAG: NAD(P)-dependent oxidoreductase [Leptolyngbyaceae cyanobacterium SM1_1_3]|nr:NAD(P)-dependent oxidoreductase [Leptolyngbyaceae cyanobacterium SM1_1_3]NJM85500.1 NAD(P)-dependent oxidoreductase [Leptolyngbyaceae cyanobacterium RM2_2_21]NJN03804.1 NAD(P)-dependent oxidoreductase [Leptolyngbyaceae cyanobacterium RM1_1_2]NJO11098.1 NAD(P)-dependent oxidoreductase [Leptolyngbyaceae cyanobacterium SL_1_1]
MPRSPKRILITGASGCIGHYIVEALMQKTPHELFLLLRNPSKLLLKLENYPQVQVLEGDLRDIDRFSDLLSTVDVAILTAAAWGDPQVTYEVNVTQTLRLMELLDPDRCQQVIYFSTASILDKDNQPLKAAHEIGTDYIRSKYICHEKLRELAIAPKITTVFPTLVFGGDKDKPASHISGGLGEIAQWMKLIRFFKAEGSFHFIHAADIARVVGYLVDHPPLAEQPREWVLGNSAMTADQAIEEICQYLNQHVCLRLPLSLGLANVLISVFHIRMAEWDRFCLRYRHFVYQNPISPPVLGLESYCPTVTDLLEISGI